MHQIKISGCRPFSERQCLSKLFGKSFTKNFYLSVNGRFPSPAYWYGPGSGVQPVRRCRPISAFFQSTGSCSDRVRASRQ